MAVALSCIMAVRTAKDAAEYAPPRAALAAATATPADAAVIAPFLLQIRRLLTPKRLLHVWPSGLVSPSRNLPPLHDLLPALLLMTTLWELRLGTALERILWLHACQLAPPHLVCSKLPPQRPEQACNGFGMIIKGKLQSQRPILRPMAAVGLTRSCLKGPGTEPQSAPRAATAAGAGMQGHSLPGVQASSLAVERLQFVLRLRRGRVKGSRLT